jgi:BirA family biotin operon repressor/biotin-[acetyl-CoA-carboxylase] ligase
MEVLDWQTIRRQLRAEQRLQLLQYRLDHKVDSTNNIALQHFSGCADLPAVCFAECQTQGRGRHGRRWVSPESQNIYMSLAWGFKRPIDELALLSLAVGVVLVDILRLYGVDADLKWPNDIQVRGKKLAGVLLESRLKTVGEVNLVIGIGLNVSMADTDAAGIEQAWTDLSQEKDAHCTLQRSKIAGELLSAIMQLCNDYEVTGFKPYREKWLDYDICTGAEVQVVDASRVFYGRCLGINDKGALRVMVDGYEQIFYAADVSVRVNSNAVN